MKDLEEQLKAAEEHVASHSAASAEVESLTATLAETKSAFEAAVASCAAKDTEASELTVRVAALEVSQNATLLFF